MDQKKPSRRKLLKTGGAGALASASLFGKAPAVHAKPKYKWTMVTSWPKNFPGVGVGPFYIQKRLAELSDGRLTVDVKSAGEMVGALEVFDTVSSGKADMGHSAAYYWAKKHPALNFFTTVPFGLSAQEMSGWLSYGGGIELWDEVYAQFGLKAFAAGNTGVQMGGWFNKKINDINDFKGLKMRMPGLGGEAVSLVGCEIKRIPGGKIYESLKNKVIDASEFVGPYNDLPAKFHEVAKYYYWPGWHEPGAVAECMVNKKVFEHLPKDLQAIVTNVMESAYVNMLADYTVNNNVALTTLVQQHKVELHRFSDKVLAQLGKKSDEVLNNLVTKSDPLTKKVFKSFSEFRSKSVWWNKIGEEGFSAARSLTFS